LYGGQEEPRAGGGDGLLEVLGEPSIAIGPARVRSTTQRRGRLSKPLAASDRLMIAMAHLLM